jgi:hypothetical protein
MVKGNWERRAEISMLRREKEKERKVAKKAGYKSSSAVAASLLNRSEEVGEYMQCYCFAEDREQVCCSEYLRTGSCENVRMAKGKKKDMCKLGHDTECLRDVFDSKNIEVQSPEQSTEERIIGPFDLRVLSTKRHADIAFIGVNGELVFDHVNPQLWVDSPFNLKVKGRSDSVGDAGEGQGERGGSSKSRSDSMVRGDDAYGETAAKLSALASSSSSSSSSSSGDVEATADAPSSPSLTTAADSTELMNKVWKLYTDRVCSFLCTHEVARAREVNRTFKVFLQSCSVCRERVKEASTVHASALSKRKKAEKKKNQKAAGVGKKNNKIDGFARGGATGN